jgi:hypothetical protein
MRMTESLDLDPVIARYTTASFDDLTPLPTAGIESLSLLRLAAEVATDQNAEIDATRLVDLRTVGDLKLWLLALALAPADQDGAPC